MAWVLADRRVLQRAAWALVLACALTPGLGRAAPDPSLRVHFDFESYETIRDGEWWSLPDRSPNGFHMEIKSRLAHMTLVPTEHGHALRAVAPRQGFIDTNNEAVYHRGEGVTLTCWAAGEGWMRPLDVDRRAGGFGVPLAGVVLTLTRAVAGIRWSAVRADDPARQAYVARGIIDPIDANQWIHFAAVYDPDSSLAVVYINGVEVGREEAEGHPIGGWGEDRARQLRFRMSVVRREEVDVPDGPVQYIDDLRLYARALSPAEIKAVMRLGSPLHVAAPAKLATSWAGLKGR